MSNKVKDFWENCGSTFAHLTVDQWLKDKKSLFETYQSNFLKFNIDPSNKSIIDYGIGGGYLGEYLLSNYSINNYIGIDIAERSIKVAKDNLKEYNNVEFHLSPMDFSKLKADLFISFAVIQHFPNKEYLEDFLKNLNSSNISELLLQIRHNRTTKFTDSYESHSDVRLGCVTNPSFISKILTKYKIQSKTNIQKENNYQYLYFTKK
jgi:2-polyprenyl-3-methyl-5-hydroxy-6-metoxy-1,4-benzoquinol methylase